MKFVVQICISVIQIRTLVKKFSVYINQIKVRVESIQIRHRSGQRLNWMTVLRTCCIFREFERHKFRFEWHQCKFECWENKIEWRIGCAWPKSSKLNAHKMNLVDKITKLTGKSYIARKWDFLDKIHWTLTSELDLYRKGKLRNKIIYWQ